MSFMDIFMEWLTPAYSKAMRDRHKFPLRHPDRIRMNALVEAEYAACSKQESAFYWKYRGVHRFGSLLEAKAFADEMCKRMSVHPVRKILPKELDTEWMGAYQKSLDIHIPLPIRVDVLVHELTHHIVWERMHLIAAFYGDHGKVFCKIEQEMFDSLLKKPIA